MVYVLNQQGQPMRLAPTKSHLLAKPEVEKVLVRIDVSTERTSLNLDAGVRELNALSFNQMI